ncbi:MAG TPA: S-methyl-5'-thioadenosine phosphorylase, partial [Rhodanobacteraceae bacterium]
MSIALALIGGTGLYRFPGLEDVERDSVDTPYGKPSGDIVVGNVAGKRVAFLARHGEGHSIAPHRINYRANVWALHR